MIKITKDYVSGNAILEPDSKTFGRSAYLCYNQNCIDNALKKNKLNRALKTKEDLKGLMENGKPVLSDLQSESLEYQHLQCETEKRQKRAWHECRAPSLNRHQFPPNGMNRVENQGHSGFAGVFLSTDILCHQALRDAHAACQCRNI